MSVLFSDFKYFIEKIFSLSTRVWVSILRASSDLASQVERWRESNNMICGELRGQPLGLHTNGQTPKVKGLQSVYMAILFSHLAPTVQPLDKSSGPSRMETQTLVKRPNFFSIKYSESDKRTLIIYFNGLLSSPLERSLGFGLSA